MELVDVKQIKRVIVFIVLIIIVKRSGGPILDNFLLLHIIIYRGGC